MTQEDNTFNKLAGKRNLYLISQDTNTEYDTYSDAIVAAWTEDEARNIHPRGYTPSWMISFSGGDWAEPKDVSVKLIGVAEQDIKGVVLASFHAG